jgi:hypothetical protein
MKSNGLLLIGALAVGFFLLSSFTGSATGPIDLSSLTNSYDPALVQRLQNLQSALSAAGLNSMQIQLMLSQSLLETGLFTSVWNQNATDNLNNWAGISNADGSLKSYASLSAFVADYIPLLQKGADPIDATSTTDFVNRLYTNCYTGCPPQTPQSQYLANINLYYNMLSQ